MFLKIATVLAILGLLLGLLLNVIQQVLISSLYFNPAMRYVFRALSVGEAVSFSVPLTIFLVAFLLSLNKKQS